MRYEVTGDFVKISETAGTIQNVSNVYPVEISDKSEADSGILLYPLNKFSFSNETIYLRCVDSGGRAEIRVTPFAVDFGGGTSSGGGASSTVDSDFATDDEYAAMMDEVWNGGGSAVGDSDDGFSEELDNIIFGN